MQYFYWSERTRQSNRKSWNSDIMPKKRHSYRLLLHACHVLEKAKSASELVELFVTAALKTACMSYDSWMHGLLEVAAFLHAGSELDNSYWWLLSSKIHCQQRNLINCFVSNFPVKQAKKWMNELIHTRSTHFNTVNSVWCLYKDMSSKSPLIRRAFEKFVLQLRRIISAMSHCDDVKRCDVIVVQVGYTLAAAVLIVSSRAQAVTGGQHSSVIRADACLGALFRFTGWANMPNLLLSTSCMNELHLVQASRQPINCRRTNLCRVE